MNNMRVILNLLPRRLETNQRGHTTVTGKVWEGVRWEGWSEGESPYRTRQECQLCSSSLWLADWLPAEASSNYFTLSRCFTLTAELFFPHFLRPAGRASFPVHAALEVAVRIILAGWKVARFFQPVRLCNPFQVFLLCFYYGDTLAHRFSTRLWRCLFGS